MATGYEWLVDKMYYGCNPFPQQNIQDGRRLKVLRIETGGVLTGDVSYTSGDKPQSETARRIANAADLDKTRVMIEIQASERKDLRTFTTYAKWVAKEILRQVDLGWIVICPDCGGTYTQDSSTDAEPNTWSCPECGIWFDTSDPDVKVDQQRLARGLAPLHPISDLLEHGPLDYVD